MAAVTVDLASDLHAALGRVVRRLRQLHTPGELTLSEASVLARLVRAGAATPGDLAAEEHVRPQAMCATLGALERRGLVGRAADPRDGRRVLMSATDAGRDVLGARQGAKAARLARAVAALDPDDRR